MERRKVIEKGSRKTFFGKPIKLIKCASNNSIIETSCLKRDGSKNSKIPQRGFLNRHILTKGQDILNKFQSSYSPNPDIKHNETLLPPIMHFSSEKSLLPKIRKRSQVIGRLNKAIINPLSKFASGNSDMTTDLKIDKDNIINIQFDSRTYKGSDNGRPKLKNQDCLFHKSSYLIEDSHLFSICDGHGPNGFEVASFIKSSFPLNLENIYSLQDPSQTPEIKILNSFKEAYQTTEMMLDHTPLDLTMSGSTFINIFIHEQMLICANIGDSRAVMGRFEGGKFKPIDLSSDHTPGDVHERTRIEDFGGIIDCSRGNYYIDDKGNMHGPLRIWIKKNEYPGLAMTRSLGDSLGKSVGVISTPDIKVYNITCLDRFIVIASDGIWEYLTSKKVVKIIGKYWRNMNLSGACDALAQKALYKWENCRGYVDDISFYIIFFKRTAF
ncbi:hypothetical protein SteCoe_11967 [Stentor coeruleus]|uniref:PPM-type phosphatase domain-containing protein n=1 Tax=Stentor coeruleus TaxID=5963 RepID=A0A1R2CBT1_9CILI|nr:hypothetical protein SteCoe_11967 [Stentor coeruleus]